MRCTLKMAVGLGCLGLFTFLVGCRQPEGGQESDVVAWELRTPKLTTGRIASAAGASLRGVSMPSHGVIWASGSGGAVLRSLSFPGHMDPVPAFKRVDPIPGGELDFRMLWAFDAMHAWAGSSGPGEASRLFETTDGGNSWSERLVNYEPDGFWDSIAFWDEDRGLLVGDAVDGYLTVLRTSDGGKNWSRVERGKVPDSPLSQAAGAESDASLGEVCFAASNGSIALAPGGKAWIGTGGLVARIWRSTDFGATWSASESGMRDGDAAAGVFALAFDNGGQRGVAVGGKYDAPSEPHGNSASTWSGGERWSGSRRAPGGYRSGVAFAATDKARGSVSDAEFYGTIKWLAVGTGGISAAGDAGLAWTELSEWDLNAIAVFNRRAFAVGGDGRFALLEID